MSIQRYVAQIGNLPSREIVGDRDYAGWVDVVLYADHVAAVHAAEDSVCECAEQYTQGVRDERERIRKAVEALGVSEWLAATVGGDQFWVKRSAVLAVIDGEQP